MNRVSSYKYCSVKVYPIKISDNKPTVCIKKVDKFHNSDRDEIEMNRTRSLIILIRTRNFLSRRPSWRTLMGQKMNAPKLEVVAIDSPVRVYTCVRTNGGSLALFFVFVLLSCECTMRPQKLLETI